MSFVHRAAGESLGYTYPTTPKKKLMLGPTPVTDYLSPATTVFLPLPHIMDPLDGVEGIDEVQKAMIKANHTTNLTALQGYQENVA